MHSWSFRAFVDVSDSGTWFVGRQQLDQVYFGVDLSLKHEGSLAFVDLFSDLGHSVLQEELGELVGADTEFSGCLFEGADQVLADFGWEYFPCHDVCLLVN